MYFKISKPEEDKYCDMGMVEITAAFYLEEGDDGYEKYIKEHQVEVPTEEYEGKTEDGVIDQEDFQKWYETVQKKTVLNPFCNHSIQFEANVTDEEILWCFEFAMEMTHRNYLKDDLVCNADGQTVNQPINYTQRKTFYKEAKLTPEADRTQAMKQELAKCVSAQAKVDELKTKDLSKTETVADYRVK